MNTHSIKTPKKQLKFTKMQGLGNDFIVVDDLGIDQLGPKNSASAGITSALAQRLCDRRFGIGADQILWLKKPHVSSLHARMEILNADGSTAEMCGNGIRAVALYLVRHVFQGIEMPELKIETLAGVKTVTVWGNSVRVDMGVPSLGAEGFREGGEPIQVKGETFRFFEVDVGNPHAVVFLENQSVKEFPVEKWGSALEVHSRFPNRTNVEFVEVKSAQAVEVRVWERGAGITLACGTGACASAVASLATGRVQSPVQVRLPGGDLEISWAGPGNSIFMEGPAKEVYQGQIDLD